MLGTDAMMDQSDSSNLGNPFERKRPPAFASGPVGTSSLRRAPPDQKGAVISLSAIRSRLKPHPVPLDRKPSQHEQPAK
jgi:hypothetical protein